MLDFLIGGEAIAAFDALTPSPNGRSLARGSRIDHFIVLTSAFWATHKSNMLLLNVAGSFYHTKYCGVKRSYLWVFNPGFGHECTI